MPPILPPPEAPRGQARVGPPGAGRLLLGRLLRDAGAERYRTVRLETADFMAAALALYRSLGFVDIPRFDGSEMAGTALGPHARYLQVAVGAPGGGR